MSARKEGRRRIVVLIPGYNEEVAVKRVAAAILLALPLRATGLARLAFLSRANGLTLDTVSRGRPETKPFTYLAKPAPEVSLEAETRARQDDPRAR